MARRSDSANRAGRASGGSSFVTPRRSTFVREGGASIKFAVTPKGLKADLYRRVKTRCRELGYIPVEFDAATRRAHMPQDIFFSLAAQVDWRSLARRMILRLALESIKPCTHG